MDQPFENSLQKSAEGIISTISFILNTVANSIGVLLIIPKKA